MLCSMAQEWERHTRVRGLLLSVSADTPAGIMLPTYPRLRHGADVL